MDDPFIILETPARFDLDEAALHERFIAASAATHPDRFTDPLEQADAAERAAVINGAYRVLRDPERRADALLRRLGGPAGEEDKSLPPDLLMEMMEAREEMERAIQADDQSTLERLGRWASDERRERLERIAALFAAGTDLQAIRLELNSLRYFRRMLDQMPA